jgi:hypothetical protein
MDERDDSHCKNPALTIGLIFPIYPPVPRGLLRGTRYL